MNTDSLTLPEARAMFLHVSAGMVSSKELLTQADRAIGDGDHGVGMARGFEAVRLRLQGHAFQAMDEMLKAIGVSLMASVGGAAGAIFGTFFRGAAKNLEEQRIFDSDALSRMLTDGLDAVQKRGGATTGDKTMVDALAPAAVKSRELAKEPLRENLIAVTEAARQGMEATKNMVAAVGKARPLGERALGHPDPGAVSTYLILTYMTEFVTEKEMRP